jgi:hypothetical protein
VCCQLLDAGREAGVLKTYSHFPVEIQSRQTLKLPIGNTVLPTNWVNLLNPVHIPPNFRHTTTLSVIRKKTHGCGIEATLGATSLSSLLALIGLVG